MKPDLPDKRRWSRRLLGWFDRNRRAMPWRDDPTPYHVWISEIMLQQTRVDTVIPYFHRFLESFPDVETLANADPDRVMKRWEGLGYYRRARNLQRAAQRIVEERQGVLPTDLEGWAALPGIGRYTAGAIASIALGIRAAVVDGNVGRVLSRVLAWEKPLGTPESVRTLWWAAESLLSPSRPGDYNQAMMELGATVCLPKRPQCGKCPVQPLCQGYRLGRPTDFPAAKKKRAVPTIHVAAGVIWDRRLRRILISQRPDEGLLGGLWEFPGGKIEAGEKGPGCLQRELLEELGIEVSVGPKWMEVRHAYTHRKVVLEIYHCRHLTGQPQALQVAGFRWVTVDRLREFAFPAANLRIIDGLEREGAPKF